MMHLLIIIGHIIFYIVGTPYSSAFPFEAIHRDGRLISLHRPENWTTAATTCFNRSGTLASIDDLKNLDSDIWEQQFLEDKELWTSNTSIHTPFISQIGCYQLEGEYIIAANLKEYGTTSVAVCYAYCSGSQYFALLGFNCICNLSRNITRKKRKNCESYESMERKNTLELYEVETDDTSARNSEDVYFKVCECRYQFNEMKATNRIVSKLKMSKHGSYYVVCFSSKKEVVLLSNSVPDWESADLACRKRTGQPLVVQLNDSQCRTLSKHTKEIYGNAVIITGKRTYHSTILIADVFDSGAFGFVKYKIFNWTQPYNWADFDSPNEDQFNTDKKHFICIKDIGRTEQESDNHLIFKLLIPMVFLPVLIIFIVAYVKCRDMKKSKGANQEKKGRESFEESDLCLYNHTESSMRILTKKETYVDTSVSEDSGKESYFSESCVESDSQKLNEEVVATPTKSDDIRCNLFALASPNLHPSEVEAGATVNFLTCANSIIQQDNGYVP